MSTASGLPNLENSSDSIKSVKDETQVEAPAQVVLDLDAGNDLVNPQNVSRKPKDMIFLQIYILTSKVSSGLNGRKYFTSTC
jgi:hypothetical protein